MLISSLTLIDLIKKVAAGKAYLQSSGDKKDTEIYKKNATGLSKLIRKLKEAGIPDTPSEYAPLVVKKDPCYRFGMPNKDYLKTLGIDENNVYVNFKFDESCKLLDLMKERGE